LKSVAKKSNDHAVFSDFSSLVGDNSHSTSGKTLVTNNTSEALISRNTTAGQLHTFLAKGLLLKQLV
jgi:hypothetical protein